MKNYKIFAQFILLICVLGLLTGCRGSQQVSGAMSYYDFGTSHVSTSPSGLVTLRAWGSGPDKSRSIEEAAKNAVYDVIFKGIKGGKGYSSQPLVSEVNARERYAEYFDRFFATNGEYRNFVTETSSNDKSRVTSISKGRQNYGITVTVDRPALKRQLIEDGILSR